MNESKSVSTDPVSHADKILDEGYDGGAGILDKLIPKSSPVQKQKDVDHAASLLDELPEPVQMIEMPDLNKFMAKFQMPVQTSQRQGLNHVSDHGSDRVLTEEKKVEIKVPEFVKVPEIPIDSNIQQQLRMLENQ